MQNPTKSLNTRTGLQLKVRAVEPADEEALSDFFHHVTAEDLRFRFLSGMREVSREHLSDMIDVDHRTSETFIARVDDGATVVAVAMIACDPALKRGEVAVSVRSGFKHLGVGWAMLRHVVSHARGIGVKTLESIESRANHEAIELEREQGFSAHADPDDPTLVILRKELRAA